MPLIRATGVSKAYRSEVETVWAARDVHFAARPGEFVCIYGASGSGKSTLLNLLAGLDLADSGEVQVGDVDVCAADEKQRAQLRLRTVGVVFQDNNLIEEFTAAENVALPLEARGVPTAAAHAEAVEQLGRVGMGACRTGCPGNCPAGSASASAWHGP